jgi:hypothetical protein
VIAPLLAGKYGWNETVANGFWIAICSIAAACVFVFVPIFLWKLITVPAVMHSELEAELAVAHADQLTDSQDGAIYLLRERKARIRRWREQIDAFELQEPRPNLMSQSFYSDLRPYLSEETRRYFESVLRVSPAVTSGYQETDIDKLRREIARIEEQWEQEGVATDRDELRKAEDSLSEFNVDVNGFAYNAAQVLVVMSDELAEGVECHYLGMRFIQRISEGAFGVQAEGMADSSMWLLDRWLTKLLLHKVVSIDRRSEIDTVFERTRSRTTKFYTLTDFGVDLVHHLETKGSDWLKPRSIPCTPSDQPLRAE